MKWEDFWTLFKETGDIFYYLAYKQAKNESEQSEKTA